MKFLHFNLRRTETIMSLTQKRKALADISNLIDDISRKCRVSSAKQESSVSSKDVGKHLKWGIKSRTRIPCTARERNQFNHSGKNFDSSVKEWKGLENASVNHEIIPSSKATYMNIDFRDKNEDLTCFSPRSMVKPCHITQKMRALLVDWIIELHLAFGLLPKILFLAINILDRFLSNQIVNSNSLLLVGFTALLLACKHEENSACVPVIQDFLDITNNAYTRADVLKMEKSILNTLRFVIAVPTPYVFMEEFLEAAGSDKDLEMVSSFLMELCLLEGVMMLKYPPSMVAAAALYTAQCILRRVPSWNTKMEFKPSYTEDQLTECAKLMMELHKKGGESWLTSVHQKYSSKFSHAAKMEPSLFIGKVSSYHSPEPTQFSKGTHPIVKFSITAQKF